MKLTILTIVVALIGVFTAFWYSFVSINPWMTGSCLFVMNWGWRDLNVIPVWFTFFIDFLFIGLIIFGIYYIFYGVKSVRKENP
ncbi:MAG: hypothetical protein QXD78_05595 [Candidatus Bathyarchaeia archaeon]